MDPAPSALARREPAQPLTEDLTPPPAPHGCQLWVYDCEVFPNHFLVTATDGRSWRSWTGAELSDLRDFLATPQLALAGFNSTGYDDQILGLVLRDPRTDVRAIHARSVRIIDGEDGDPPGPPPWSYSIDVLQLLNGRGSLKEWACRAGLPVVADSPADFTKPLPPELMPAVAQYCRNDVLCTLQLLRAHWPLVALRTQLLERFQLDRRVYALSEPRLAQYTLLTLHRRRTGMTPAATRQAANANPDNTVTRLRVGELISPRVRLTTAPFQAVFDRLREAEAVCEGAGRSWALVGPEDVTRGTVPLAGTAIALGIGGLHTADVPGIQEASADHALIDLDVASYYPAIILTERLAPRHLGPGFLDDLTLLRDQRLAAKKAGDKVTADALKIIINSTYGKLNDSFSPLRSVVDALKVTLTGQWFLLMLIEQLAQIGSTILSANTDGVTIRLPRAREAELGTVIAAWQEHTGMQLERTDYARLCRRDVNSYVGRTTSGAVKTKGAFNADSGKGDGAVIKTAATRYLLDGVDPAETIAGETAVVPFLFYQRAKNGGELFLDEQPLPGTVRWYTATRGASLRRKNPSGSWAVLPHGQQVRLALDITGWNRASLEHLDVAAYVAEAWKLIHEVEPPKPAYVQQSLFDII